VPGDAGDYRRDGRRERAYAQNGKAGTNIAPFITIKPNVYIEAYAKLPVKMITQVCDLR
jgi:hypothetical protein